MKTEQRNVATEAKLRALQDLGFIFRIPGGSSREKDHSSYGLLYRYTEGDIQIVIVPYNPKIYVPLSKSEEIFDEEPKGTLELKVSEQTGVLLREYEEIGVQSAKDNREGSNTKHIKHVFCSDIFDDSNIRTAPSPDSRLDPPLWIELELSKSYLFPGHLWIVELLETKVLAPRLR